MDLKLSEGSYLPARFGGVETVSGAEELAQRVAMKLTARRGGFAPRPDYGSRLYTLMSGVAPSDRELAARQFAAEALADEPGVSVEAVELVEEKGEALLRFTLNTGESGVILDLAAG